MNLHHNGLRKATPETVEAVQYARRYLAEDTRRIQKMDALKAAKNYAASQGLGSSKLALLDLLFKYTQPQDWTTPGVEPIIWPSNQELATGLGLGVGTMKHHLNGLARAGLITFADGPTYQRRGHRDRQGRIIHAEGISLAVIAVRYDEFVEAAEAYQFEQKKRARLRHERTTVRRDIEALLQAALRDELPGPWQQFYARLDVLRECKWQDSSSLEKIVNDLQALRADVEETYEAAILDQNFDSAVSKYARVQTTEEFQIPESSNQARPRAIARESIARAAFGGSALEEKPGETGAIGEVPKRMRSLDDLSHVSISLIQAACPVLEKLVPGCTSDWMKVRSCGRDLAIAGNINPQVWFEAVDLVGENLAISALAVTLQKAAQGKVEKPGAYMRRLIQLGRDQELFISRSLFALAGGVPSPAPQKAANPARPSPETFPLQGGISFTSWSAIVREYAPKPTPDVDIVAQAFRRHMSSKSMAPDQPDIKKAFVSFCSKWGNWRN